MAVDVCSSLPLGSTRGLGCFFLVLLIFPSVVSTPEQSNRQIVEFPPQREGFLMGILFKNMWGNYVRKLWFSVKSSEVTTSQYAERVDKASILRDAFKAMGADFFNDTKIVEVVKDATELNLPHIRENRDLVASENGGLHNPSCLVFNPEWSHDHSESGSKRFKYPTLSGVKKPTNDEDIAFMSILELGELIRTKQINSQELVRIYLERLKRTPPWDTLWTERHYSCTWVQNNLGFKKFQGSSP